MKKSNLKLRTIIILVITLLGLYKVIMPPMTGASARLPRKSDFTWGGIKHNLRENINLGLDLQGGSHLVMRVKTDAYLAKLTEDNGEAIRNVAKESQIQLTDLQVGTGGNYTMTAVVTDPAKLNEFEEAVKRKVDLVDWSASQSGNTITWTLNGTAQRMLAENATEQAKRIIESRLDAFGVAEPLVQRHGSQTSHQILVQMPGQDPERVKDLLKAESRLELVKVVSQPNPAPVQTYNTEQEAKDSLGGNVPPNRKVLPYSEPDDSENKSGAPEQPKKWAVIEWPAVVDGRELRNAAATQGRAGSQDYQIQFSLKPSGAEKFGAWTGANINQYMGVVLNDEVKSIAYIKSQIFDQGEITGRFRKERAEDLALTLRSGALPAPIEYLEERTVGASLGDDSIRAGVRASVFGLLFVVVFMLFYYRGSGVNAVVALMLNMILMLAALVVFEATLTLPGIAGIILTIGMAVDSNVLVFERIRDELRTGKTVASSVDQGFKRAIVTIIDTHVTTVISSLFLFVFGTGALRGFAVTLIIGLLINLFSAVYVSRTIFLWLLSRKGRAESLSI